MLDHVEGAGIRVRRKDMAAEAEPCCGKRQHTAQLSSAQNSDGGFGFQHGRCHAPPFGRLATALVCFARQASRRLAILASESPRIEAAISAALIAPGLPI